jgi:hypothetical protein
MLWTTFHFQPGVDGVPTLIVAALCQTLFFWMATALIFSRRDVTISPE